MKLTPAKKVLLIFLGSIVALYISLPKTLHLDLRGIGIEKDYTLVRKDLDVTLGSQNIQKEFDLVLGLDLAGGSHLVFEVETSGLEERDKENALDGLKEVIERRVNAFGISEPNVQLSAFEGRDRIIVELPGVDNTESAIALVGQTAQLTFEEVGEIELPEEGEEIDPQALEPQFFPTGLTGADLKRAFVDTSPVDGSPVVSLEFTEEGAEKFSEITERNIGRRVAMFLDDALVSAPVVSSHIPDGKATISADGMTTEEAKYLSIQLNAGALPLPIQLVEERTVGATLGAESVAKSIEAGLVGLGMVLLFMILVYGKMGAIADIGLIIFGVITLSLYKLIPVVLTLPGIAGFLLSVGMAVDSNILIFERFKEEKDKHSFAEALEISFGRAWDSIRDANIATLVTAFILANPLEWSFLHTSGPVRGFAITLALGIAISLFTGVVVTRNLMRVLINEKTKK